MKITGQELNINDFCICCQDYGGDRIILSGDVLTPILNKQIQDGLDLTNFYKNVSQVNILRFALKSKQKKILTDIDQTGVKFIAIYLENKTGQANNDANKPVWNNNIANSMIVGSSTANWFPTEDEILDRENFPHRHRKHGSSAISKTTPILYWKKHYTSSIDEFVTAILNGSLSITSNPFVSDRIAATINFTFNSDNTFKLIDWSNLSTSFINGQTVVKWMDATYSWNDYSPLVTTNSKLVVNNSTLSVPFVIEDDINGNYKGGVATSIQWGSIVINIKFAFHGVYGNTFVIDSFTLDLDGHLVGSLFIKPGTLTFDFTTTPMTLTAAYSFLASSGLIKVYDKIVSLMILTSTDNEPIGDIELFNGSTISNVNVSVMIGS